MTRFGSFWPITTTVLMVSAVVIAAVVVAPVIEMIVIAVSWAMSAHILVEAYFGLFGIGVLIDSRDRLANPLCRLMIELGV